MIRHAACAALLSVVTLTQSAAFPSFRMERLDAGQSETAALADLNRDGKLDIVSSESWFEAPAWTKRPIRTPRGWLEAPADPRAAGPWTFHPTDWLEPRIAIGPPPSAAGPAPGARGGAAPPLRVEFGFMHVIDLNKDGRNDVLTTMAHSFGVLWFEQTAAGAWNQHLVDNTWSRAHAAILADVNKDGQVDLVTGTRFMGRNAAETEPLALCWYEFRPGTAAGGQEGPSPPSGGVRWLRHTISEGGEAGVGLQTAAADLDGDGDVDIVSGGKSGLFLARNIGSR